MRHINNPSVWNNTEFDSVKRIIVFSSQNLLDLFCNEIEGQISDGYWENSRGTNWMWEGKTLYMLGDKTKVYVNGFDGFRRTNYYLSKELRGWIGERATDEAGFSSIKEMTAAWNEIADAIKNAESFTPEMYKTYVTDPEERRRNALNNGKAILRAALKENCADYLCIDGYTIQVKNEKGETDYSFEVEECIDKEKPENSCVKIIKNTCCVVDKVSIPVYAKPKRVAEAINYLRKLEKELKNNERFL